MVLMVALEPPRCSGLGTWRTRPTVGTDQEVELALSYLARTFRARLDINRANSMDFRRYVGLSERDGDAIVAYRQRHGRFSRWQDLERVPGINFKKVRERSEILVVDPEP